MGKSVKYIKDSTIKDKKKTETKKQKSYVPLPEQRNKNVHETINWCAATNDYGNWKADCKLNKQLGGMMGYLVMIQKNMDTCAQWIKGMPLEDHEEEEALKIMSLPALKLLRKFKDQIDDVESFTMDVDDQVSNLMSQSNELYKMLECFARHAEPVDITSLTDEEIEAMVKRANEKLPEESSNPEPTAEVTKKDDKTTIAPVLSISNYGGYASSGTYNYGYNRIKEDYDLSLLGLSESSPKKEGELSE